MNRLALTVLLGGVILMPIAVTGSDAVYGDLTVGISGDFLKTSPPLVAQVPAITNTRYPWNVNSDVTIESWTVPELKARGCRGEYVPVTFLTLHGEGRTNVMVTAEPFHNDEFTFPDVQRTQGFEQPCTDIRWVKWWWQSGRYFYDNTHPVFVPELLLHDLSLVASSEDVPNVNTLRDGDFPQDAATLQPMTIPAGPFGYQQQVWMTIYIPQEAPPGLYEGSVLITSDQTPDLTVPIRLYVWPFELVEPRIDYSIYYRAKLAMDKQHKYSSAVEAEFLSSKPERFVGSELRTMAQMKADIANMVRHGVTNPASSVPPNKESLLPVLNARRSVGCDNTRIFNMGGGVGQQLKADLSNLRGLTAWAASTSKNYMHFLRRYGVKELGRYGKDESHLEDLARQVPLWQAAQQDGAFVYTAINVQGFEEIIEDALGVAVIACGQGYPTKDIINTLHEAGTDVYVYGNPQCGNEDSVIYRLAQGLKVMASGVDGSMDYAWQHVFPHGGTGAATWNDFANCGKGVYRSHMMTYPGVDTPVDTLQWEGFAAGITDAGYLTTLEAEIDARPEDCTLADEAQEFIDRVYAEVNTTDLEAMRLECAQWIIRLQ